LDSTLGAASLVFSSTTIGTYSRPFVLDTKNKAVFSAVAPPRTVSLSLVPASGLFTGSFQDPDTGMAHSFSGMVDQSAGTGAGFFLGTKGPGNLLLSPAAD
jgi:hypothetical protein